MTGHCPQCTLSGRPSGTVSPMRLVPYSEDDFELTAALESDPAVMRDLGGPAAADQIRLIHEKRLAGVANGEWYFVIVPDGTDRTAGIIAVWPTPWDGGVIHELGLMVRPEFQRQRVGWQATQMLIERARRERAFPSIHALVAVGNVASNEGCQRLGFELAGQSDVDYEGRPLRSNHWIIDLTPDT